MSRGVERSEAGAIAIVVAVFSLVMFGLAALVVDLGLAREVRREAQNNADAAALAGVGELYGDDGNPRFGPAADAVRDFAFANGVARSSWTTCAAAGPGGYVQAGSGSACILFDSPVRPTRVWVAMPGTRSGSFFGGALGYAGSTISASAEGKVDNRRTAPCAFCVMNELQADNGEIEVTGGGSINATDITLKSNGELTAAPPGSINSLNPPDPPQSSDYSPNPPYSGVPVDDPFMLSAFPETTDWPIAKWAGTTDCGKKDGSDELFPGIYETIRVRNGPCTLNDGLYVITELLDMSGNDDASVIADDVTLYFICGTSAAPRTCNVNEKGGWLDATGNGEIAITGWSWPEFSILYDRNNASDLRLAGNGLGSVIAGAIYARNSTLLLNGNGEFGEIRHPVVVGAANINGNNPHMLISAPGLTPTFVLGDPFLSR